MKERQILFSAPMVRALLAGTKTQTRRAVKPQPPSGVDSVIRPFADERRQWAADDPHDIEQGRLLLGAVPACPYGVPGDRLWVRETWTWNGGQGGAKAGEFAKLWVTYAADGEKREIAPGGVVPLPKQPPQREGEVYSLRDAPEDFRYDGENTYVDRLTRWWRRKIPAIHMFRWASRISLEVTGVRVERLQAISEADAIAEGIERAHIDSLKRQQWKVYPHRDGTPGPDGEVVAYCGKPITSRPAEAYKSLWLSINGPGSWDANPWVWVVEFRRLP